MPFYHKITGGRQGFFASAEIPACRTRVPASPFRVWGPTLNLGSLAHEYATCRQRGLEEGIWVWCHSRVNREALLESSVEGLQGSPSISGGVGGNEVSEVSSVSSLISHHLPPQNHESH